MSTPIVNSVLTIASPFSYDPDTGILSMASNIAATTTITPGSTATGLGVVGTALTSGKGVDVSALDALTTGAGISLESAATAITGAGRIFTSNHTGATGTSAILNEFASAATDETVIAKVTASAALALGTALAVASASTTGTALGITSTAGTTGGSVTVTDSSADTGTRSAVTIAVSNASASGATPLTLTAANAAKPLIAGTATVQSTHFYRFAKINGVQIFVGDGTTANGALTGVAGDLLINGGSNKPEYCTTTGTVWAALV